MVAYSIHELQYWRIHTEDEKQSGLGRVNHQAPWVSTQVRRTGRHGSVKVNSCKNRTMKLEAGELKQRDLALLESQADKLLRGHRETAARYRSCRVATSPSKASINLGEASFLLERRSPRLRITGIWIITMKEAWLFFVC